jgi:hypothetical protein
MDFKDTEACDNGGASSTLKENEGCTGGLKDGDDLEDGMMTGDGWSAD